MVEDTSLYILPTVLDAIPSATVHGFASSLVTSVTSISSEVVMSARSCSSIAATANCSPDNIKTASMKILFFIF
ncbi:MAG: hypothetical protein MSA22_01450, partial [Prevotella sp.]|nr:hypothetical protein [Prevotella sp.]